MIVYHFNTSHQPEGTTNIIYRDGTIEREEEIASHWDYTSIKESIATDMMVANIKDGKAPQIPPESVVVHSLTRIAG